MVERVLGVQGSGAAVQAAAVEREVMVLDGEAGRRQPRQVAGAGKHVEHPLAMPALKVVVVAVPAISKRGFSPGSITVAVRPRRPAP
jgi:hypothetical protein